MDKELRGHISALLNEDWEYSTEALKARLTLLELVREPLLLERCRLQRELFEKREQMRVPNYKPDKKDKDTPRLTDFDRTTQLNAYVAELNEQYEIARGLEELVKERIEVIKLLLETQ